MQTSDRLTMMLAMLLVTVLLGRGGPTFAATTAKPTKAVLLVVADDLGFSDLGFTGSLISTPVLDHLATNGVRMRNYYVQRACSPTRAALQTGRYNIRMGFASGVMKPLKPYCLPLNETLLPQ